MKLATFQDIATRYAQTMGRRQGVNVVFGGTEGRTDGRVVYIPALPSGTVMSMGQSLVYGGYLDHETAHVRWTDFNAWVKTCKQKVTLLKGIMNVLEDVRIENVMIDHYVGTKPYLDELAYEVDKKGDSKDPGKDTVFSLFYKEAWKYRGIDVKQVRGELKDHGSVGTKVVKLLKELPQLKSTAEVIRLSQQLHELIKKEAENEETGRGQIGIAVLENCKKPGMTLEAALEAGAKWLLGHERQTVVEAILKEVSDRNNADAEKGVSLQKKTRMVPGKVILPPVNVAEDKVGWRPLKSESQYNQLKASLSQQIMLTKNGVRRFLLSRDKHSFMRGMTEGRLDDNMLHVWPTGSKEMFKQERTRQMVNTALCLLIDFSGSMNQDRARQAMIVLSEALSGVPELKLQVMGFTTAGLASAPYNMTNAGRRDVLLMAMYKSFDEPYAKVKPFFGGKTPSAYTPLGDAYGKGLEFLVSRPEQRKILWLVTDGDPCISVMNADHCEFKLMDHVHNKCRRYRIETIGMDVDRKNGNIKNYVDYYTYSENQEDMAVAILKALKDTVLKRGQKET